MDFAAAAAGIEGLDMNMLRDAMAHMMGDHPLAVNMPSFTTMPPDTDERLSGREIKALKARLVFGKPLMTYKKIGQFGTVFGGIPLPSILSAPLDEFDTWHQVLQGAPAGMPKVAMQDVMEAYPFPVPGREPYPVHRGRHQGQDMYNHPDLRWIVRDRLRLHDVSMLRAADPKEDAKRHAFTWAPEALFTGQPYLMLCAASCASPPPYAARRDADTLAVLGDAFQLGHHRLLRLSQELHLRATNGTPYTPPAEPSVAWQPRAFPPSVARWLGGGGPAPLDRSASSNATPALAASRPATPCTFEDCVHLLCSALDVHANSSVMMAWESSAVPFACDGMRPEQCRHCQNMDKHPLERACVTLDAFAVCHVQSAHCCAHGRMVQLPCSADSALLLPRPQGGGQPADVAFAQYSVAHNGALLRLEVESFLELLGAADSAEGLLAALRAHLQARWNLHRTGQHVLCQAHVNAACAFMAAVGVPRPVAKAAVREALGRSVHRGQQREALVLHDPACMVELVAHLCDRLVERDQARSRRSTPQRGVALRRDLLRAATQARGAKAGSRQATAAFNRVLALRLELGLAQYSKLDASAFMSIRGQALAAAGASGVSAPPAAPLTLLPGINLDLRTSIADDEASCELLEQLVGPFDCQCRPPQYLYGSVAGMNVIAMEVSPMGAPLHARALLLHHEGLMSNMLTETAAYRWLKSAADPPDPDGRGGFMAPLSKKHAIGTDMCYVPSLYHWGIVSLDECQMRGHLFVSSGYEDLDRSVPALVFRPGISGRLLHPQMLRVDLLPCAQASKMLFCAFYAASLSGRGFMDANPDLLKVVQVEMSRLLGGDEPTALTNAWEGFFKALFPQRTEVWMHMLHSISGVHLEPTLPSGSCCPFPDAPVVFPDLQTHAEHAREMTAFMGTSGCSWEMAPVERTNYSVLDVTVEHNVYLGQYRCKRHGRILPVPLLHAEGPSRKAFQHLDAGWTDEGKVEASSTLGQCTMKLPGGLIVTEAAGQSIFKGLMHAAKAALKAGCCIWDTDAPVHPLAVYLQMQLCMQQPRLTAHLPELNTFTRSLASKGHSQASIMTALLFCMGRQAKRVVRFVEERLTPAVCMKAVKLSFATTHGGCWEYFAQAGWPVFRHAHRNLHISDELVRRMITSECHKYSFGAGACRSIFREGRAEPYRATMSAEFEAKHKALWFGSNSDS